METLEALTEQVRAGKIRYIGVSNETPWGVMRYLQLAEKHELPRIVSIQNPYSLLNRSFEIGLAEISQHEGVELLAYSSLAFGTLSGNTSTALNRPVRAIRCSPASTVIQGSKPSWRSPSTWRWPKHGLDPSQMALAFVRQQPFVASTLLGATTVEQLKINIDSLDVVLDEDVLQALEEIHTRFTIPAPYYSRAQPGCAPFYRRCDHHSTLIASANTTPNPTPTPTTGTPSFTTSEYSASISNMAAFSPRFCTAIALPAPTECLPRSCSNALSGTTKKPPACR